MRLLDATLVTTLDADRAQRSRFRWLKVTPPSTGLHSGPPTRYVLRVRGLIPLDILRALHWDRS